MFWKSEDRKQFSTHTEMRENVEDYLRETHAKNGLQRANSIEDCRTSVLRKAKAVTGPQR
jgi:hypothetical protein